MGPDVVLSQTGDGLVNSSDGQISICAQSRTVWQAEAREPHRSPAAIGDRYSACPVLLETSLSSGTLINLIQCKGSSAVKSLFKMSELGLHRNTARLQWEKLSSVQLRLFALSLGCCLTLGHECVGVITQEWVWETTVLRPEEQLLAGEKQQLMLSLPNFLITSLIIYLLENYFSK